MIKTQLAKLVNSQNALLKIQNADLPIQTAFSLKTVLKEIGGYLKNYEETLFELYKKYSDKKRDEKGNETFTIKPDKKEKFESGLKQLLETEISLNFEKLKFGQLADIKLSASDVLNLEWFFEETSTEEIRES